MRAAKGSALLLTPVSMITMVQQGTVLNVSMGTSTKNTSASTSTKNTSMENMSKANMSKENTNARVGTTLVTDRRKATMITGEDCTTAMSTLSRNW